MNYTGTATASASYTWNFNGANVASGSGQGPYTLNWPTSGNYTLSLDVTENGCAAPPQSVPVVINAIPVASVAPASAVCVGQPGSIAFNGTALPGASYTWSFGSGTVMSGSGAGPYSVQWAAAGSQSISLTVTQNGCTNSTTSNITVNPIPTAQFTIPPSICVNNPFLLLIQAMEMLRQHTIGISTELPLYRELDQGHTAFRVLILQVSMCRLLLLN
ncbi:MAG: PKD domain-containing protein [Bacteroidetes bacterium]|nr:PKD domain-containing protein [Bacteroidota bacterium]